MANELADILACVDVPELHTEVTAATDNRVSAHLNCIDGARVSSQLFEHYTGIAVPHTNRSILRAGHNMFVIESQIQDSCAVVLKTTDWAVPVLDTVDNTGAI